LVSLGSLALLGLGASPAGARSRRTADPVARAQSYVARSILESIPPAARQGAKVETTIPLQQPFYQGTRSAIGTGQLVVVNAKVVRTSQAARATTLSGRIKSTFSWLAQRLRGTSNRNYLVELDSGGKVVGRYDLGSQSVPARMVRAVTTRLPLDVLFHDVMHSANVRKAMVEGALSLVAVPHQPQIAWAAASAALYHLSVGMANRHNARNEALSATLAWAQAYKSQNKEAPTLGLLYDQFSCELEQRKSGTKPYAIDVFLKNLARADRSAQVARGGVPAPIPLVGILPARAPAPLGAGH
jgi:hypothetical protein